MHESGSKCGQTWEFELETQLKMLLSTRYLVRTAGIRAHALIKEWWAVDGWVQSYKHASAARVWPTLIYCISASRQNLNMRPGTLCSPWCEDQV